MGRWSYYCEKGPATCILWHEDGKEVLPPLSESKFKFTEEFGGMTIPEALEEAKKFVSGAFRNKIAAEDTREELHDRSEEYRYRLQGKIRIRPIIRCN